MKPSTVQLHDREDGQGVPWRDFARTGPGTLAGRFLRLFWQPVYLAADLAPGRAVPLRIMGEDFTLYRGENLSPNPSPTRGGEPTPPSLAEPALSALRTPSPDSSGHSESLPKGKGAGGLGQPHLLPFRCAHRGTQLSTGWVEGDDLRCFYHGWKYDGSGQCVEQPAEPEPFCQRIRLRAYPTQEYQGLIFAFLGEGEPPELPRFPELEGEGVLRVRTYTWPCNYFQSVENNLDATHVTFAHQHELRLVGGRKEYPLISGEETSYGIRRVASWSDGSKRVGHFHIPNVSHLYRATRLPGSWMDVVVTRVPVDDETFVSFGRAFLHVTGVPAELAQAAYRDAPPGSDLPIVEIGSAILRGETRTEDAAPCLQDATRQLELEDYVAQVGQGTIAARVSDRLGRADAEITLLREIWARELHALAEGRSVKRWTRPSEPLQATAE